MSEKIYTMFQIWGIHSTHVKQLTFKIKYKGKLFTIWQNMKCIQKYRMKDLG